MSKIKHTPGPWKYDPDNERSDLIVRAGGLLLAEVNDTRSWPLAQCQANARLIAAAPDMLAALQAALELSDKIKEVDQPRTDECQAVYNQVKAAIDKATK